MQEAAKKGDASESDSSTSGFGNGAPWMASESISSSLDDVTEEHTQPLSLLATPESSSILEESDHAVNASNSQEAPVGVSSTDKQEIERHNA